MEMKHISVRLPRSLYDAVWRLRGEQKIKSVQEAVICGLWKVVDQGGIDTKDDIQRVVKGVRK